MTVSAKTTQSTKRRWWLWLGLLSFALWLTFFGDSQPKGGIEVVGASNRSTLLPADRAANRNPTVAHSTVKLATPLEKLQDRHELFPKGNAHRASNDLFAAGSWSPPPAPAPAKFAAQALPPQPPPAPTAPPIPFSFLGKKLEANVWEVYLSRGEQTYVVREGSAVENNYRILKITPPQMSLLYLPLNQTQTLSIGESP